MFSFLYAAETVNNTAGMLFACWAIVIVMALMFIVFMRAHKKEYALAIVPLIILPLVHIFSAMLANLLARFLPLAPRELRMAIDVTAGLISCLLIGLTARHIPERRTRNFFSICCSAFIIILTLVLVVNMMMQMRA